MEFACKNVFIYWLLEIKPSEYTYISIRLGDKRNYHAICIVEMSTVYELGLKYVCTFCVSS